MKTIWSRPSDPKLAPAWDFGVEKFGAIERMVVHRHGYTFMPGVSAGGEDVAFRVVSAAVSERRGRRAPKGDGKVDQCRDPYSWLPL